MSLLSTAEQVAIGLSYLIRESLTVMEGERTSPGYCPDRMDDKIKFYRERAAKLRKLREEFENVMSEQCGGGA